MMACKKGVCCRWKSVIKVNDDDGRRFLSSRYEISEGALEGQCVTRRKKGLSKASVTPSKACACLLPQNSGMLVQYSTVFNFALYTHSEKVDKISFLASNRQREEVDPLAYRSLQMVKLFSSTDSFVSAQIEFEGAMLECWELPALSRSFASLQVKAIESGLAFYRSRSTTTDLGKESFGT